MKKSLFLSLFILTLLLTACGGTGESMLSDADIVATAVAQIKAESSTEEVQLVYADDIGGAVQAGIPGLNSTVLNTNLAEIGFACSLPEWNGSRYSWTCDYKTEEYEYTVTAWGRSEYTVDLIEASAFYYGNADYSDLTSIVFGEIAALQYQGSMPEQAQIWGESNVLAQQVVGDEALTNFGGVNFYLYTLPSLQVLEIGSLS